MENLIEEYQKAADQGAVSIHLQKSEEFHKIRKERIEEQSGKHKIVIAPHSASFFVDYGNDVKLFYGECNRKAFLDYNQAIAIRREDGRSVRRMDFGNLVEAREHDFEEAGKILLHKNYRMSKEITPEVVLSCEVDSIVKLPSGRTVIAEHKTYDGYNAKKHIQGNTKKTGMPKYDHIAQGMFYLSIIQDHFPEIDTMIYCYRDRSDMLPTYHVMKLEKVLDPQGNMIDAFPVINGTKYDFVSVRQLLIRGITLAQHIINNKLPQRDPDFKYSEDKIRVLQTHGLISKKAYKDWEEGKDVGDWQCIGRYCPYRALCLGNNPSGVLPSDADVLGNMHNSTIMKSDDLDNIWNIEEETE